MCLGLIFRQPLEYTFIQVVLCIERTRRGRVLIWGPEDPITEGLSIERTQIRGWLKAAQVL